MGHTRIGSGGAGFNYRTDSQLEEIDVPVITLDEYFYKQAREVIHFIKCDVEGHEYQILKGGEAILRRDVPILFVRVPSYGGLQRRVVRLSGRTRLRWVFLFHSTRGSSEISLQGSWPLHSAYRVRSV